MNANAPVIATATRWEVPTAARMSGTQTSESFDRVWANLAAVVGWLLLLSIYR